MTSANNLSEEQITAIRQWAEEGSELADIQKSLKGQFGVNVTYMDTRMIVLDLGIELKSESVEEEAPSEPEGNEPVADEEVEIIDPGQAESPTGPVQVATDEIPRPGAVISGSVTFSDGEKASWMIDELGRPGIEPETSGYQPTEADLSEFEKHLRALLEG